MLSGLIALTRAIAGAFFFGLLLSVVAGVFSRYALNAPLTFTDEIAGYLFAGSVLLGIAVTAFHGGHIRVDVFLSRLPPAPRRRIELLHGVIALAYAAVLLLSGVHFFLNALSKGLRAPTVLQTPVALVGIVFPISMALFFLERIAAVTRTTPRAPTRPERSHGL